MYEVVAMVKQLGIPTWFMTLSCADLRWPELFQIIARANGKNMTAEEVETLSYNEKLNKEISRRQNINIKSEHKKIQCAINNSKRPGLFVFSKGFSKRVSHAIGNCFFMTKLEGDKPNWKECLDGFTIRGQ